LLLIRSIDVPYSWATSQEEECVLTDWNAAKCTSQAAKSQFATTTRGGVRSALKFELVFIGKQPAGEDPPAWYLPHSVVLIRGNPWFSRAETPGDLYA